MNAVSFFKQVFVPLISSQIDEVKEEQWPCVLCMQTEGCQHVCDDEAWSVWYWPVDVTWWFVGDTTLTRLWCTSILHAGCNLSLGSFLSPPLFPLPPPLFHSHSLVFSHLLFIPPFPHKHNLPIYLHLFPFFSFHPPSWIKLFIWPRMQPAGTQANLYRNLSQRPTASNNII